MAGKPVRARNDPAQYDDLADQWWRPRGTFAMLHWLAAARAALVPPAARPGAVLVDVGCGAGLLAPHVAGLGYRLAGVDLTRSALVQAARHGVTAVQGDALALPLAGECADVVCAGEILEHVTDLRAAVREAARILRPGGVLVIDTIAGTALARFLVVTVAERIPGAAPPRLHDPSLFVDRRRLVRECAEHGIDLRLTGLRPSAWSFLGWLLRRHPAVKMVPTWSTSVLFQGRGTKEVRRLRAVSAPAIPSTPQWTILQAAEHVVTVVTRYADGPQGRGAWVADPRDLPALNQAQIDALGPLPPGRARRTAPARPGRGVRADQGLRRPRSLVPVPRRRAGRRRHGPGHPAR
jgi:2-polyprenyl-6-hydroxyphenyl methylase/3-demethylubiquinone-9 3-methyltransferase